MHTVDVLTSIEGVSPGEWDSLRGELPFVGHRWLHLAETVLADHRPRYLLVRRQGKLVAAAVGALEHRLQNPRLDARFGRLLRRSPFLHVAVPMTASPGLLVGDGPDPRAELDVLLREIRDLARRERSPFCVVDHLPAPDPAHADQRGYLRLGWLPDTRLDLTWPSFDDYLADLPSKRRREIRRTQRRAEREGIVVRPLIPTAEDGPALDRMVADVTRRHGAVRHYGPDLFVKAATVLGADLTLLAAHRDGTLVGCIALLRDDDDLAVRWIGRDYERTAGTAAYHALLAACVRNAISSGARTLRFGAAAYETKKQFGVSLEPRSRLFAARSRAVTSLMGLFSRRFDPPELPAG